MYAFIIVTGMYLNKNKISSAATRKCYKTSVKQRSQLEISGFRFRERKKGKINKMIIYCGNDKKY